ncbi:MAG TPA: GNAT family N-acetyltransferase, partial [Microlunatus sp.]
MTPTGGQQASDRHREDMSGGRPEAGDTGEYSDEPVDRDVLTNDRRIVRLRSFVSEDHAGLTALYERASARSRYLRFFSAGVSTSPEVARLTRAHDAAHRVIVAEHAGTIIAVASYEQLSAEQAEMAILVDDLWHGHGVGTLLLEMLAAVARHAGIGELVGDVLVSNKHMLGVTAGLGTLVPRASEADRGVLQVRIPTLPGDAAVAASLSRERAAERQSLRPLFTPSAVAVVGASRNPGAVGHEVVRALQAAGFRGRIYPVNPAAGSIAGLPATASVQDIREPIDLAVIAVPAAAVATVVAECATAGVGAAVVLTALTSNPETDGDSVARMVQNARAGGMRLVGPNCIGVINTDADVRLAATFAASSPTAGHLAVASQSGAVGIAILEAATRAHIGISSFVSLGNKAD